MAQQFDVSWKILFRYSHGIVAQDVFGGEVEEWLNVELPAVANPRVDLLVRRQNGRLRHVEIQTRNQEDLVIRQLGYYSGFWNRLGEHVEQVLVYAGRAALTMPGHLETPSLRYQFRILNLREMDGEPLLASDDWGDNVIALLTKADREKVIQAVEAQIRRLEGQEQADALQTFVILSGILGIEEQISRRLEADMIDLMENKVLGPMIRKGLQQGLEQGLEQGLREGREEGRAEGLRRGMQTMLRDTLDLRFGRLPVGAIQRLEDASVEQLRDWNRRAAEASSLQELLG